MAALFVRQKQETGNHIGLPLRNRDIRHLIHVRQNQESGGHGGPPLRDVRRVLLILRPFHRIIKNVFPRRIQFRIIADDPFVIIALP